MTVRPGRAHATVEVYDPTVGTDSLKTHTDVEAVRLTLSDHPVVLAVPQK